MVLFLVEELKNVETECIERVKAIQHSTGFKYVANEIVEVDKKLHYH